MFVSDKRGYIKQNCGEHSVALFNVMEAEAELDEIYARCLGLWLNDEKGEYSTTFLRDELVLPLKDHGIVKGIVKRFGDENTCIAPHCLLSNLWYELDSASANWKRG